MNDRIEHEIEMSLRQAEMMSQVFDMIMGKPIVRKDDTKEKIGHDTDKPAV